MMNDLFDFDEICNVLEQNGYTLKRLIGRGGFAKVFLVYSEQYKEEFAAKVFPRKVMNDRSLKSFEAETNVLKSLLDPHIIYSYDSIVADNYFVIIMEYCPYDSVQAYVKKHGPFSTPQCLHFFQTLLQTIYTIHKTGYAHLDLKPQNILIDKNGRLKISDFGLASVCDGHEVRDKCCGSVLLMPPEMLAKIPFNPFKCDIWSLGITFYYMARGEFPWNITDPAKLNDLFQKGFYLAASGMDQNILKLIRLMVVVDQHHRADAEELLKMEIFKVLEPIPSGCPFIKAQTENKLPSLFGAHKRRLSNSISSTQTLLAHHRRSNSYMTSKSLVFI